MGFKDEEYLKLCGFFEEKSKHAKLCFNTDDDSDENPDDANSYVSTNFHYKWIVLRSALCEQWKNCIERWR